MGRGGQEIPGERRAAAGPPTPAPIRDRGPRGEPASATRHSGCARPEAAAPRCQEAPDLRTGFQPQARGTRAHLAQQGRGPGLPLRGSSLPGAAGPRGLHSPALVHSSSAMAPRPTRPSLPCRQRPPQGRVGPTPRPQGAPQAATRSPLPARRTLQGDTRAWGRCRDQGRKTPGPRGFKPRGGRGPLNRHRRGHETEPGSPGRAPRQDAPHPAPAGMSRPRARKSCPRRQTTCPQPGSSSSSSRTTRTPQGAPLPEGCGPAAGPRSRRRRSPGFSRRSTGPSLPGASAAQGGGWPTAGGQETEGTP